MPQTLLRIMQMFNHHPTRRSILGLGSAALAFVAVPLAHAASETTIRSIQEGLAAMGFDPGIADGKSGSNTERAIEAFQREFGYAATGQANDVLLGQINTALGAGAASPERLLRREGLLRAYSRAVQEALIDLGYDPGTVDGAVGPMTRDAIRAFQSANAIAATGEVSKPLLEALNTARGI
jgi:peptidoglycan hydrolase-like protein with peptidoglycan-binding domain